jgi:hypothetical protein
VAATAKRQQQRRRCHRLPPTDDAPPRMLSCVPLTVPRTSPVMPVAA